MTIGDSQRIGVIADDFTGAVDAGVEFVRAGLETMLVITASTDHTSHVEIVSTDSRDGDEATARARVAAAATQMRNRRIFKKIDSTMRGHLGGEIIAMLDALGPGKAVVCPAAIEAGRVVREGQLWVNDQPLQYSDFARDPRWPATTAHMAELVGAATTHIPLANVRAGVAALAASITHAPTQIVTVDACDHDDITLIGQAILFSNSIPCGALGLARAWARCQSDGTAMLPDISSQFRNGPILAIAGSRHPRTRTQVRNLATNNTVAVLEAVIGMDVWAQQALVDQAVGMLTSGRPTVIRAPLVDVSDLSAQRALVEMLGDVTLRVCQAVRVGGLMLTGGETASVVSHRLGVTGVRIVGELEVGMPWGLLVGGIINSSLVVTKAGGFGSDQALVYAVEALNALPHKSP